jgi:hypothetical protein
MRTGTRMVDQHLLTTITIKGTRTDYEDGNAKWLVSILSTLLPLIVYSQPTRRGIQNGQHLLELLSFAVHSQPTKRKIQRQVNIP